MKILSCVPWKWILTCNLKNKYKVLIGLKPVKQTSKCGKPWQTHKLVELNWLPTFKNIPFGVNFTVHCVDKQMENKQSLLQFRTILHRRRRGIWVTPKGLWIHLANLTVVRSESGSLWHAWHICWWLERREHFPGKGMLFGGVSHRFVDILWW